MFRLGAPVALSGGQPDPAASASCSGEGVDPARLLTTWLAETAGGDDLRPRLLRLSDGTVLPLPLARWAGPAGPADLRLLERASGPVLDLGCGPGRLTAALHRRGTDVLGVELLEEVPVQVRAAGAPLHVGDLFDGVPAAGRWASIVLADGNIGIGGDPVRLLSRVRQLLAPGGHVLVELQPGSTALAGPVRLEGLGVTSTWFAWDVPGAGDLPALATAAGLAVRDTWCDDGRAFACLVAGDVEPAPSTLPSPPAATLSAPHDRPRSSEHL